MSDEHDQDAVRPAADDTGSDAGYDPRIQQAISGMLSEWSASLQTPPLESPPAAVWERIESAVSHAADGISTSRSSHSSPSHTSTRRLRTLPGFGEEKAQIFIALLAKRFDIRPQGWEKAAGPFSDHRMRTVADITSQEALLKVRAFKKREKARDRDKAGKPLRAKTHS